MSSPRFSGLNGLARNAERNLVPLQAQFELTGRCHLDCVHCYLDIKNPPKDELTTAEVVRVLDELKQAGTMFLTLTGGEVFLRRDLFEIMEAANERQFAVRLFTSGTLLDRERVQRLAQLRPVAVEISIYGVGGEAHERVTRRRGSLRKSLRGAVLLRRAGVPVVIKSPLLAGSKGETMRLVDLAHRIGAGCKIDPTVVSRRDGGVEPLDSRPSVDHMAELYGNPVLAKEPEVLPGRMNPDAAPCAIARRVVRIAPNGDVHACGVFPISAGNLRSESFSKIWRTSPILEKIRGIRVGDLRGECSSCSRQGYCGRCSSQALLEHGDFKGPSIAACDRALAKETAAGVEPPAGARRMSNSDPLGRRALGAFVPVADLLRSDGGKLSAKQ